MLSPHFGDWKLRLRKANQLILSNVANWDWDSKPSDKEMMPFHETGCGTCKKGIFPVLMTKGYQTKRAIIDYSD